MWYRIALISLPLAIVLPFGAAAQEGNAEAGAVVFKKCAVCHVVDTDTNKVGP